LAHIYLSKLSITSIFHILYKSKTEKQLKFKQYSTLTEHARTIVKLLRRETPDCIIALNPWLLNIPDFGSVGYKVLAMLQELVCQHPM